MKVGYVRVSAVDQNEARQLQEIELDKVFTDYVSGKSVERPALQEMLGYLREGDTLYVHSMDRLARNLIDLRGIVSKLTAKGVAIRFIKENLQFSNDSSPMSLLILSVMGAFAEFERSLIRERQKEGIELAKKKGVYKGRTKALNQEQVEKIREKIQLGVPKSKIAKEYGINRATLYNYL